MPYNVSPLFKLTASKLYHSFIVSPLFATLAFLIEPLHKLLSNEIDFFTILTFAILIDLVIGALKYAKLNSFSFKEMLLGLIVKCAVAYGGMTLFIMFSTFDDGAAAAWFILVAKFTVLLYPAGSSFSNMYCLTGGRFPPINFMRKLKSFDDILTPSALLIKSENDEKTEP